jgi:hypothetical protein
VSAAGSQAAAGVTRGAVVRPFRVPDRQAASAPQPSREPEARSSRAEGSGKALQLTTHPSYDDSPPGLRTERSSPSRARAPAYVMDPNVADLRAKLPALNEGPSR